jgi:hypothetical protein
MKTKNAKQNKHSHPGRPKYAPKFPRSNEWTFTQFMEANDIETNPDSAKFGKGPNCTMLTLRKFMKRDMWIVKGKGRNKVVRARPNSLIVNVRGVTAEPNSESGLGRRANLYALRAKGVTSHVPAVKPVKATAPKVAKVKVARKARTPKSTSQTPTADVLDKIHAALATPEPAPALTVPAVTIAPEAPAPAPAPAEVAPAAPVAEPVAEVAPAPAPVAAPVSTLVNS